MESPGLSLVSNLFFCLPLLPTPAGVGGQIFRGVLPISNLYLVLRKHFTMKRRLPFRDWLWRLRFEVWWLFSQHRWRKSPQDDFPF